MTDSQFWIGFHFTDGKDMGGGLHMGMNNAFDYAQAKSFLDRMMVNSPDYAKQGLYFVTRAQYEEFLTARAKWNGWR